MRATRAVAKRTVDGDAAAAPLHVVAEGKPREAGLNDGGKSREVTIYGVEPREGWTAAEREARASTEPEPEAPDETPPEKDADTEKSYDIVRATTRFEVNVRGCMQRTCKRDCDACKRAKATLQALDDVDRMCTLARNVAMRALVERDGRAYDEYLLAHDGALPKTMKEWLPEVAPGKPKGFCYSYPRMVVAVPRLSTNVAANMQRKVDRDWTQDRFEVMVRQSRAPRYYKVGQPIPVPRASVLLAPVRGDGGETGPVERLVATFALFSRKHEGERRITLELVPRDAKQKSEIQKLGDGTWRYGELTVVRDRLRPSRWYVRVAYTRQVERLEGGVSAAVTRGMRTFLVGALGAGETWMYDGEDIEAYLRQVQRRRKEYQYASKASGRVGHGRERTLSPTRRLEGAAERWRDSRIQTIAARLGQWLLDRHVTTLFVEDFTGVRDSLPEALQVAKGDEKRGAWVWERVQEWPYYRMGLALVSFLEGRGVTVYQVPPKPSEPMTKTCPKCGHVDDANRDLARWRFRCTKCQFKRHLDVAQCLTTLVRGESGRKAGEVLQLSK